MVVVMNKQIKVNEDLLSTLSIFLRDQFGLSFPQDKYRDLERGIISIMEKMGEEDPASCVEKITTMPLSKEQTEVLTTQFTVGETYFFREPDYFNALKNIILPEIIAARCDTGQLLRIWSAGCSTGEEPYSIAILISELIKDLDDWNVTILATDINIRSLQKLEEGIYGEWSFRNVPDIIKEKYFNKHGKNTYEIKPLFKKMVKANYLNLAQDAYPSLVNNTNAMDIIFCRNLLMYFEPPLINQILSHLKESLIEDGYIIVGSSEHSLIPPSQYVKREMNNAIFYQKKNQNSIAHNNLVLQNNLYEDRFILDEKMADTFLEEENSLENYLEESKDEEDKDVKSTVAKNEFKNASTSILHIDTKMVNPKMKVSQHQKKDVILDLKNEDRLEEVSMLEIEKLARQFANEGKLQEALHLIEKGLHKDKCNTLLHYLKALVFEELSLSEEAVKELNKTLYLDPNFILAYFSLGNIAINQHRINNARKYYSIVLTLTDQYSPEALLPGSEGCLTAGRMRDIIRSKKLFQLE